MRICGDCGWWEMVTRGQLFWRVKTGVYVEGRLAKVMMQVLAMTVQVVMQVEVRSVQVAANVML